MSQSIDSLYNVTATFITHRSDKRGYKPLKVENLVEIPPQTDPTDPLFIHQWYLVSQSSLYPSIEMIR